MFKFRVYGEVRGQARPRTDFIHRKVYKTVQDVKYERRIKETFINSNGEVFGEKPIKIRVDVYRELPDSYPKRIKTEADTHKPDASNILKSVEDALNGIAYNDDKQIVDARCIKHPRTRNGGSYLEITIEEAK